jgi:hypothetical protein
MAMVLQLSEPLAIFLAIAVTLFLCAIAGPSFRTVVRPLQRYRIRKNQQHDFVSFLQRWRARVEAAPCVGQLAEEDERIFYHFRQDHLWMAYRSKCAAFNAKAERICDRFDDAQQFRLLASRLGSLRQEDWGAQEPKTVILGAMDALLAFVG